ncbi:MAG: ABC transporter permease [Dictyoglomus sp. NZ13-RE01]|nr:MAG: ABC transporter permease [Dictyoglomus sp. NZ13-RE01]
MQRKKIIPYLLIAPAMLIMIAVTFYPLVYSFYIAMTNMSMYSFFNPKFIGLENFKKIFSDIEFYILFFRTVIWTVVNVFFHVVIGVMLALLLNKRLPGSGLFRILLILPWATPQYIVALTWRNMFNFRYGAINLLLEKIGLQPIPWLSDPFWAFVAVIITNIWLGFPFMTVVTLGGLQAIPPQLYEAADVDGANPRQKLFKITLPLLKPVLIPAITLGVIWTFNMLNVIFLITRGGPGEKTHILVTKMYTSAFDFYRYGYASALSVVVFIILLIFSAFFIKLSQSREVAR